MGVNQCPDPDSIYYYCTDRDDWNCTSHVNVLTFFGSISVLQTIGIAPSTSAFLQTQTTLPTSTTSTSLVPGASTLVSSPTPSATTDLNSRPQAQSSPNIAVPIGVAVPLGVLAIAALSFLLYHRGKKKQKRLRFSASTGDTAMRPGISHPANDYTNTQQMLFDTSKPWSQDDRPVQSQELSAETPHRRQELSS